MDKQGEIVCAVVGILDGRLATMHGYTRILDTEERRIHEEHYGPLEYEWGEGEDDPLVAWVRWNNTEVARLMDRAEQGDGDG